MFGQRAGLGGLAGKGRIGSVLRAPVLRRWLHLQRHAAVLTTAVGRDQSEKEASMFGIETA